MTHDRDYYRAIPVRILLILAVEQGLNPEMSIAIAEKLAEHLKLNRMLGKFTFAPDGAEQDTHDAH